MRGSDLIEKLAQAVAEYEGYFVTADVARQRGIPWPTRAQRNANPGNIRRWRDPGGKEYPRSGGYVDFVAWARHRAPGAHEADIRAMAEAEGWRALRKLIADYIDGKYTCGRPPTLRELIARYAPASDGNVPERYVAFVARRAGIDADKPLKSLIVEGTHEAGRPA